MSGRLFELGPRIAARRRTAREEREHAEAVAWRKGVAGRRRRREAQKTIPPAFRRPVRSELVEAGEELVILCDLDDPFRHRQTEKAMAAAVLAHFRETGELAIQTTKRRLP